MEHLKDIDTDTMISRIDNMIPFWMNLVIFGSAYYFTCKLGLNLRVLHGDSYLISVAAGLHLAALILSPYKKWIYFIFTSIAIKLLFEIDDIDKGLGIATGFHLTKIVEVILGAWLIRQLTGDTLNFSKLQHVLKFVVVILIVATVSGLIGAYFIINTNPETNYWSNWQIWSLTDVLGMLTVTPAIVFFNHYAQAFAKISLPKLVELVILLSFTFLLSNFVFNNQVDNPNLSITFPYILYPLLPWAILRFSGVLTYKHISSLQIVISILAFLTLILSTIVSEKKFLWNV